MRNGEFGFRCSRSCLSINAGSTGVSGKFTRNSCLSSFGSGWAGDCSAGIDGIGILVATRGGIGWTGSGHDEGFDHCQFLGLRPRAEHGGFAVAHGPEGFPANWAALAVILQLGHGLQKSPRGVVRCHVIHPGARPFEEVGSSLPQFFRLLDGFLIPHGAFGDYFGGAGSLGGRGGRIDASEPFDRIGALDSFLGEVLENRFEFLGIGRGRIVAPPQPCADVFERAPRCGT